MCAAATAMADPIAVKHMEGEVHAFLTIRDDDGKLLGYADELNVRSGNAWRSRLTIHFLDGSLSEETAVYTQGRTFHLLTDHLVQKGPSFPKPADLTIDTAKGQVTWQEETKGRQQRNTDTLQMPADLANGIMPMLLQNMPATGNEIKVGYIVLAPKPRLVKFAIHPDGQAEFKVGAARPANHYRVHIEIGGVEGLVAPVLGKEPPDYDVWVSAGDAPTFLMLRGIQFIDGPMWTLQLTSPEWPGERLTRRPGAGAQ